GQDRDDHREAEWQRGEARPEADEHQDPAEELRRCGEARVEPGRGDVEAGEEVSHVAERVQLAPAGPDEDEADREARQRRPVERQLVGRGAQPIEQVLDGREHGWAISLLFNTPRPSAGYCLARRISTSRTT